LDESRVKHIIIAYIIHPTIHGTVLAKRGYSYCILFVWLLYCRAVQTHGGQKLCRATGIAQPPNNCLLYLQYR